MTARAPTLTLGATTIGPLRRPDSAAVAAAEDPAIRRAWERQVPTTEDDARRRIEAANHAWAEDKAVWHFAVRRTGKRPLIGWVTVKLAARGTHQVDCWIAPAERKAGHAARALELVCRFAFCELGVPLLEAEIAVWNRPSIRLARSIGFTRLRHHLRGSASVDPMVDPRVGSASPEYRPARSEGRVHPDGSPLAASVREHHRRV